MTVVSRSATTNAFSAGLNAGFVALKSQPDRIVV
jgi:hypothetical protein